MADVAQLVRALDCGSKSRGFKSRRSPIHSPAFKIGQVDPEYVEYGKK